MTSAEIIQKLDAIQNEFLVFDATPVQVGGGFRETSLTPDVRIARAVHWIEKLKQQIQAEAADVGSEAASIANGCSG